MTHVITLSSPVEATDGPVGQIVAVVINPNTSRIEYLGVQSQSSVERLLFVPIGKIVAASAAATTLEISRAELAELPTLGQQPRIAATFQSNVADLYLASDGTAVRSLDGALIGVFAGAVTDALYRIERLLLADDGEGVPIAGIAYAEADGLAVRLGEREAAA